MLDHVLLNYSTQWHFGCAKHFSYEQSKAVSTKDGRSKIEHERETRVAEETQTDV